MPRCLANRRIGRPLTRVRSLWHQLSETLEAIFAHEAADAATLSALYARVVAPSAERLAPLRVAQCAARSAAAEPLADDDAMADDEEEQDEKEDADAGEARLRAALAALGAREARRGEAVREHEARAVLLAALGARRVQRGRLRAAARALSGAERALGAVAGGERGVVAAVARAQAALQRAKAASKPFYDAVLRYLAHTPLERVPAAEQRQLALGMALAALAGDDIYNFGALLGHPLFDAQLRDSWLGQLLAAVNVGDIDAYERLLTAHKAVVAQHAVLVDNAQTLREKVSILALMTLALGRSSRERSLSFAEIAAATHLQEHEVELLLMKALALGLVRGSIDEVDQVRRRRRRRRRRQRD